MKFVDLVQDQNVHVNLKYLNSDVQIEHITCDSREIKPGWAFAAIKGHQSDGTKFIPEALAAGAAAVFCDHDIVLPLDIPNALLYDSRNTIALLARNLYDKPDLKLAMIGVTGTNGKTTTTTIIRQLMHLSMQKCGLIGGVVNISGNQETTSKLTTPDGPTFYRLLKASVDAGDTMVAVEVSSHSLMLSRVYGACFQVGIFTNLTQDHLDFHCDMESYFQAKIKLFLQCKTGLINIDDPFGNRILANGNYLSYGLDKSATYRASNLVFQPNYTVFNLTTPIGSWVVKSPLFGMFNVYNLLAALASLAESDFDLNDLLRLVPKITGAPGRLEQVNCGQPFKVIIDYAHTPDAIEKLMVEGRRILANSNGRLHVLFGCGGDRDRGKRPLMARTVADGSDVIWHTSDNSRWENPEAIMDDGECGILKEIKEDKNCYHRIADRSAAIAAAVNDCRPGDLLLLVGKGHEAYQEIMGIRHAYSDKETVRAALMSLNIIDKYRK